MKIHPIVLFIIGVASMFDWLEEAISLMFMFWLVVMFSRGVGWLLDKGAREATSTERINP